MHIRSCFQLTEVVVHVHNLMLLQIFLGKLSRLLCVPAERYVSIPTDDTDGTSATLNPSGLTIDPDIGLTVPKAELTPSADTNMEKTLQEIREYLRLLTAKAVSPIEVHSHKENIQGEWLQFTIVLDRMLLVMYLLLTFLITAVMYGRSQ